MNNIFTNNKTYVVNSNDLQKVFEKYNIKTNGIIDNAEFVKNIHEITQTISTYTSSNISTDTTTSNG